MNLASCKKDMKISAIKLLSIVALSIGCDLSQAVDTVSVCGARKHSTVLVGKHISARGTILSDGFHALLFVPDECPEEGYPFYAPNEGDPADIIRQAATRVGLPGTSDKSISIDLDGEVVLDNGRVAIRITKLSRLMLTYPRNADAH